MKYTNKTYLNTQFMILKKNCYSVSIYFIFSNP